MDPNVETATEQEFLAITNAFLATSNALGDAIRAIKRIEQTTFDVDEARNLMKARQELETEAAINERTYAAYCDQTVALHTPTQDQIDEIVQLAGQVAVLTQKADTAEAILTITNKIVSEFKDIVLGQ